MESRRFGRPLRAISLIASTAIATSALTLLPATTTASAADAYLGATSAGRGTVLGSANYAPPAGAIFVNATSGVDSNAGSLDRPVKTVAQALTLAPAGGTVVLRAGTYHESVTVKKQLTIQNYPGEAVWFDGSSVVSNWTQSGSTWTAPWNTFFAPSNFSGGVRTGYTYATYPAQVFVDGAALRQVGSAGEVTAGTFFADATNRRLVIGSDPAGATVASSDLDRAIAIGVQNVNLRGFGVRRYATTSTSRAAVLMDPDGGTFENLVVSDNASIGLALSGANKTIRNVTVERNGMMGLGMDRANNAVITNSVFRNNNTERFPTQPVASGMKITKAAKLTITNNLVADNYLASGIWLDNYCSDVVITGNTVTNNGEMGINFEASNRGVVANNTVVGGRKGIELRDTENSYVMNNHVRDYTLMAIYLAQDDRWTNHPADKPADFSLLVRNNIVANNVVACGARFQIFGKDDSTHIPMDEFNVTITGNLFSPYSKTPERNMVGWGLDDNVNVEFIQSTEALAKKNASWKNLQSSACESNPEKSVEAASLTSIAMPIPATVASVVGVPAGTTQVGLVNGATTTVPVSAPSIQEPSVQPPAEAPTTTEPAPTTEPTPTGLARDKFNRKVPKSWGTATTGGTWTATTTASTFSVSSGSGTIALQPATEGVAVLSAVSSDSTDSKAKIALTKARSKGTATVTLVGRQVGSSLYGGRVQLTAKGKVLVSVVRDGTQLGSTRKLATKYSSSKKLYVRTRVSGTSPTTIAVKVWYSGKREPAKWTVVATDATAALQSAGTVGIKAALQSSAKKAKRVRVYDYWVNAGPA